LLPALFALPIYSACVFIPGLVHRLNLVLCCLMFPVHAEVLPPVLFFLRGSFCLFLLKKILFFAIILCMLSEDLAGWMGTVGGQPL